jgi:heat-inducible transcriptional repressor
MDRMDKRVSIDSERYRKILRAIIKEYVLTAVPVSSKAISERYSLGLSPATIRGIMAELEGEGFLVRKHASAGRTPTEKSFRFYVDSLLEPEDPPNVDKDLLKRCSLLDTDNVFMETTRALSELTRCAGLVFVPGKDNFIMKHIRLLPMDSTSLMVLLVSSLGRVRTRLVRVGPVLEGLNLEEISNYLNSIGRGRTLKSLRARILKDMKSEKSRYDELLAKAFNLGSAAFQNEAPGVVEEDALYLEGQANIFDQPEFKDDFERMKKLFAAFEQKSLLVKILDHSMEEDGIHICMGSESSIEEFDGLSFVTAPYGRDGEIIGTLGVIGPVRMDYSRIVPLVSYTAGLLSKVL